MIWNSWAEFFAMGGYGLYVWGSTVVVAACMLGELVSLRLRRKAIADQAQISQRAARKGNR